MGAQAQACSKKPFFLLSDEKRLDLIEGADPGP